MPPGIDQNHSWLRHSEDARSWCCILRTTPSPNHSLKELINTCRSTNATMFSTNHWLSRAHPLTVSTIPHHHSYAHWISTEDSNKRWISIMNLVHVSPPKQSQSPWRRQKLDAIARGIFSKYSRQDWIMRYHENAQIQMWRVRKPVYSNIMQNTVSGPAFSPQLINMSGIVWGRAWQMSRALCSRD